MLKAFLETPISHQYNSPNYEYINWLKENKKAKKIAQSSRIIPLHTYKKMGLKGTLTEMYARSSVILKLIETLELLPNEYSFNVFDAFRTIETQQDIFNFVYNEQKNLHPELSHTEIFNLTKEFVILPTGNSLYSIPPHNSGGAIDLTLTYNGKKLDMGTEFDAVTEVSNTSFFEQEYKLDLGYTKEKWIEIRLNRRILFNVLKEVGFTNYKIEWWHYDLGDCMWHQTLQTNWYYPSMEKEF